MLTERFAVNWYLMLRKKRVSSPRSEWRVKGGETIPRLLLSLRGDGPSWKSGERTTCGHNITSPALDLAAGNRDNPRWCGRGQVESVMAVRRRVVLGALTSALIVGLASGAQSETRAVIEL